MFDKRKSIFLKLYLLLVIWWYLAIIRNDLGYFTYGSIHLWKRKSSPSIQVGLRYSQKIRTKPVRISTDIFSFCDTRTQNLGKNK